MSEVSSDKLLDLVRRSELVTPKKLDSFVEKLKKRAGGWPKKQEALSKLLIEANLLTQWQADKLLAGKHRGFRLKQYKLLGQIGKGGMSHVYLAEHTVMERRVALKVLPRQRVKDRSYLARFRLEARAAARLDDPNIVRVYDIDSEGDTHYIVMEYVDGRDLHQTVTQDGPLKFEVAADYIAQVANGLEHAHQMGLVHRDIKPANCLLDAHKTVKLLDMGLAKLTDDETSLTLANDENVLGTADYLAPEQALNSHGADARADIYSLGCTLYFLLVGKPPFPDGTISERLLKHQVEQPESLLNLRPDCPLSLEDICSRMMRKKPEDRIQTAGEVAIILNDWLADRGYSPSGSGVGRGSGTGSGSEPVSSGIGSGILSRFTSTAVASSAAGTGVAGTGTGSSKAGSSGRGSPLDDTAKLYASSEVDTDEDIGLAPLEDEDEGEKSSKSAKGKKASPSSGVLSDESGPKLAGSGGARTSAKDSGIARSTKSSLSSPSGPPKSIFDEVLLDKDSPILSRATPSSTQYNPLHPPGYVNPYMKTPWYVWVGVAVGLLLTVAVMVWALS